MSQELLANCLFIISNSGNSEIRHEAIQLLDILIEKRWIKLDMDDKECVVSTVYNYTFKNISDHLSLQALHRTLDSKAWLLSNDETQKLTHLLTDNLINKFSIDTNDRLIYFSIKILSVLFTVDLKYLSQSLEMFVNHDKKLSSIINETIQIPKFFSISKELIKLAASIHQCEAAINYLNYDNLVMNLQIPELFEF